MIKTRRLWVNEIISISIIAYDGYNLETSLKEISQIRNEGRQGSYKDKIPFRNWAN
jgi:hypothetical protein